MKAIQIVFDYTEKPAQQEIIPIGDTHIGAIGSDEGHIRSYVEYIRAGENRHWWIMGDTIEAINYSDPRFDPQSLASWMNVEDLRNLPMVQANRFLELTEPIHDKCLFMLHGNHEESVAKHSHFDVAQYICNHLKVPYLGYSGLVTLTWRWHPPDKRNFTSTKRTLFAHHGWGGGRKYGGKVNKVFDFLSGFDADDYFMGHVHDVVTMKTSRIHPKLPRGTLNYLNKEGSICWREGEVVSKEHCFALTGTFLKSALYAEQKGYNPSFVGAVRYSVDPFQKFGKHSVWRAVPDVGSLTL